MLQFSPINRHWVKVYLAKLWFIMNNIDISNPNVPENDQNWIEIVVMAIIYKKVAAVHHFVHILNF